MNIDQLRYLIDLNETGSFTKTANNMFITQQAVSRSVQQLEKKLGITILIRTAKGVIFTEEGKLILQFAEEMLEKEEALLNQLKSLQQEEKQQWPKEIKINSSSSVINLVLPQIITRPSFKRNESKITIDITTDFEEILINLQKGEKDIGLLSINEKQFYDIFSKYENELQADTLLHDDVVVVTEQKNRKNTSSTVMEEEYYSAMWTGFNIYPSNENIKNYIMVFSSDVDFHRIMMEQAGAFVSMPSLAYRCFFNKKKYLKLSLKNDYPIIHVAIYRKDAPKIIQQLASMIRVEMSLL